MLNTPTILAILAGTRSIPETAVAAKMTQQDLAHLLDNLTPEEDAEFSILIAHTAERQIA